jgi:hypothetical protein
MDAELADITTAFDDIGTESPSRPNYTVPTRSTNSREKTVNTLMTQRETFPWETDNETSITSSPRRRTKTGLLKENARLREELKKISTFLNDLVQQGDVKKVKGMSYTETDPAVISE